MIIQQLYGVLLPILFIMSISPCNEKPVKETTPKQLNAAPVECEVKPVENEASSPPSNELSLSKNDIELIALVTMAEAEGECEKGKRLVIDTILNRVDHDYWPDTVSDVIYQPHQFSSMWNGRVDRCYVSDDIYQLVVEELDERLNYDIVFFTADKYGKYGTPLFQVGNHYFSTY